MNKLMKARIALGVKYELRQKGRMDLYELYDENILHAATDSLQLANKIPADGILARILEFLRSDEGKKLIKMIVEILLSLVISEETA